MRSAFGAFAVLASGASQAKMPGIGPVFEFMGRAGVYSFGLEGRGKWSIAGMGFELITKSMMDSIESTDPDVEHPWYLIIPIYQVVYYDTGAGIFHATAGYNLDLSRSGMTERLESLQRFLSPARGTFHAGAGYEFTHSAGFFLRATFYTHFASSGPAYTGGLTFGRYKK